MSCRAMSVVLVLGAVLCTWAVATAKNDDGRFDASPHREWFEGLKLPDGMSCCGLGDSHFTDDYTFTENRSAVVKVKIGDKELTFVVPPERVLEKRAGSNPVGRGVIFLSPDFTIAYCFVPASQA